MRNKAEEEGAQEGQRAVPGNVRVALKAGLTIGAKIAKKYTIKAGLAVLGAFGPYAVAAIVLFLLLLR